jgi:hypothetical protein
VETSDSRKMYHKYTDELTWNKEKISVIKLFTHIWIKICWWMNWGYVTIFLLMFASCCLCITNNSMCFLPSTQHLFNSHYMFRPQRVIFRCYKHMVLKLIRTPTIRGKRRKVSDLRCNFNTMCL